MLHAVVSGCCFLEQALKAEVARVERNGAAVRGRTEKHMEGLKALEELEPVDAEALAISDAASVLELLQPNQQQRKESPAKRTPSKRRR